MVGIGHQGVAAEVVFENPLTDRNALLLAEIGETERIERLLSAFHDKRRCIFIELIGMRPDPAVLGFLKYEGEGIRKGLMGAKPDKLAGAHIDLRLELVCVSLPHAAV